MIQSTQTHIYENIGGNMVINVVLIIIGVFIYLIGLYMTGFTSKPKRWKTVMGIVLIFIGTIIAIAGIDQVVRQLFLLFF